MNIREVITQMSLCDKAAFCTDTGFRQAKLMDK